METPQSRRLALTLEHLAARGADIEQLTGAIVSTWKVIESTLAPVVGKKGVAALYARSLHLTVPGHGWLAALPTKHDSPIDLVRLEEVLAQQGSINAAAGGGAHLQSMYELLSSLVGPSLTGQLLRTAWDNPFDRPASEDISP